MSVTIEVDAGALQQRLHALGKNAALAQARAINRTTRTVRTHLARAAAAELGIPQSGVRSDFTMKLASRQDLKATIVVSGARIPLILFKARQTKKGVTYALTGGRSLIPSGFIATMRSGHRGVFKRLSPSRPRRGLPRGAPGLPIKELFGPSLKRVVSKAQVVATWKHVAATELLKNLRHEISFLLTGRGVRASEGASAQETTS